jgi:hypothetical protein
MLPSGKRASYREATTSGVPGATIMAVVSRLILVIAAVVIVSLSACTEPTIRTSEEGSGDAASGPSEPAQVGGTIQLHGNDEGLVMAVTVSKVDDPAKAPKFFGPGKGKRYVAVEVRLENVGTAVYNDSPATAP